MSSQSRLIAGLDIGSHKVCCFIAERTEMGKARVIGYGQHISSGIKYGNIVDMDQTEQAIRRAVHQAEEMAGEHISSVVVSLSGNSIQSQITEGLVLLNNQEITGEDLERLKTEACALQLDGDREILHALQSRYTLDGQPEIRDPRGMLGNRLEAKVNIITASKTSVRNIVRCVDRCNLEVEEIVVQPYASALSCLVDDEKELGVALVDIGGGTCNVAIYIEGTLAFAKAIAVGGDNITSDIAHGLSTPINHAERIKTLYGCAMAQSLNSDDNIQVPKVGEDAETATGQISRAQLAGIIQPRCEEILEMVRDVIEKSGFENQIGRRVVLTGGTAQLSGFKELSELVLDKTVRVARPFGVEGLTDLSGTPQFSTAAGLVIFGNTELKPKSKFGFNLGTGQISEWFNQLVKSVKESFQTT